MKHKELNEIKTPYYLYDHRIAQEKIALFKRFIEEGTDVFFALKASNFIPLVEEALEAGFGIDIASKEEMEFIYGLGVDPKRMCFSTTSKTEESIQYAHDIGVDMFCFDTQAEAEKIKRICKDCKLLARLEANCNSAVINLSSKFGMTPAYFKEIVRFCIQEKIDLIGVAFHVGSQNPSVDCWGDMLKEIDVLIAYCLDLGLQLEIVDLGGGMPASYTEDILPLETYIESIIQACRALKKKYPFIRFIVEPGRSIAAETMTLVTKVIDIKDFKHPPIVIVDCGIYHGLIEALEYYNFHIPVKVLHKEHADLAPYTIGGISGDGTDIMKHAIPLPKSLAIGDLLEFSHAGAYSFVYENFHMIPFPKFIDQATLSEIKPPK